MGNFKSSRSWNRTIAIGICLLVVLLKMDSAYSAASTSEWQKPWNLGIGLQYGSGLYKFNDESRSSGLTSSLSGSWSLDSDWSLGFAGSVSTRLNGVRETKLNDGSVSVSYRGGELVPPLKWNASLAATLPISEKSRKTDDLITAITGTGNIILPGDSINLDALQVIYSFSLTKAFNRYETNFLGESIKEYSMQHRLGVAWTLFSNLSLSASASRRFSRTHSGKNVQSFGLSQTIRYSGLGPFTIAAGHMNGGDVLKANGQDSNIALIDKNSSSVFAAFGYQY